MVLEAEPVLVIRNRLFLSIYPRFFFLGYTAFTIGVLKSVQHADYWIKDGGIGRQDRNLLPKHIKEEKTQQMQLDLKRPEHCRTDPLHLRRKRGARVRRQSQDGAGLKPSLQPSLHAGERGTDGGRGRLPGVLHIWPWGSAPGAQAHVTLGSGN